MSVLLKYLKRYRGLLAILLIITWIQAWGNLSLPNYMSNIVNIGIQREGLKDTLPLALSVDTKDRLQSYMTEGEVTFLETFYHFQPSDGGLAKDTGINILAEENVWLLEAQTLTSEDRSSLTTLLDRSWWIDSMVRSDVSSDAAKIGDSAEPILNRGEEGTVANGIAAEEEPPRTDLSIQEYRAMVSDIPTQTVTATAAQSVLAEYEKLGIDKSLMRSAYIKEEGIKMLVMTVVVVICTLLMVWLAARTSAGIGRDMRRQLFAKGIAMSEEEYEQFSTSSLITRTTNDIQQIQQSLVIILRVMLSSPFLGLGAIIMAFSINRKMSLIVFLSVALVVGSLFILFKIVSPYFMKLQRLVDRVNLVLRETLTGLLVVRAFNAQDHEEKKFDNANQSLTDTYLFISKAMVTIFPWLMLILNFAGLAIVWFGGHQVAASELEVGNIMAFIQYANLVIFQFMMLSMVSIMLPRSIVSARRVDEVVTTPISITDPEPKNLETTMPCIEESTVSGRLEFDDVTFTFPDSEMPALCDINFVIEPGETVAIIGGTGSGKSTICKFIPRFFDVSKGQITFNNINVRDYPLDVLREKIAYIPQQALLFSGTVRDNLKLGKNSEASDEVLLEALDIAMGRSIIENSPKGLDMPISRGGTNVSGGQRQRLCIARALIGEPELVIFDDSFSALDFATDAQLRRNLRERMGQTSFLIVAQRISTIRQVSTILVLDEGRIVGMGSHDELIRGCKVYQEIAESQLSPEEWEGANE